MGADEAVAAFRDEKSPGNHEGCEAEKGEGYEAGDDEPDDAGGPPGGFAADFERAMAACGAAGVIGGWEDSRDHGCLP